MDSKNENDKVNMPSSPSLEPMIAYIDDLDFFKDFKDEFPAIAYNDLKSKSDLLIEPSIWHLYHLGIRGTLGSDTRLRDMTRLLYTTTSIGSRRYEVDEGHALFTSHAWRRLFEIRAPLVWEFILEMTWSQFILALGLHTEEEKAEARFGAYWQGSERVIPEKGDFRDYWIEISSDRDGHAPKKGRKGGDGPLGGHFIGHLAAHFGLPDPVAGDYGAAEDAPAADEGAQADPEPVHAPQPPPPAPKIIQQKVSKLGEMLLDRSLIRADLPLGWSVV
ncbi:hypothetical protein Tco_0195029 [Tanacetum coccineum]